MVEAQAECEHDNGKLPLDLERCRRRAANRQSRWEGQANHALRSEVCYDMTRSSCLHLWMMLAHLQEDQS